MICELLKSSHVNKLTDILEDIILQVVDQKQNASEVLKRQASIIKDNILNMLMQLDDERMKQILIALEVDHMKVARISLEQRNHIMAQLKLSYEFLYPTIIQYSEEDMKFISIC